MAVSEQGEVVLGTTLVEATQRADAAFGDGGYLFKIGEIAVGRLGWRVVTS